MKILVLANFPPFVMGGAENQVARLSEAWLNRGHEVEVAGFGIPDRNERLGKHFIRLHHLSVLKRAAGRAGRGLTYLVSLMSFLARNSERFDIVYSRGLGEAAITVCIAKKMGICKLPLVACPINARGEGDANFIRSIPGSRHIVCLINRHCNGINIIAKEIRADLADLHIDGPLQAEISNGIPVLPIERLNRETDKRRLIFTGRLSEQKGLDLLIFSLYTLYKKGYDFSCDIIGEGPLEAQLKQLIADLSLNDNINLNGAVAGEDVRNLLLQSDVFILPSRYEGMSNSVLEAMESGLPVLATRCGGIDQYIGAGNGWTCETDNQGSLTDALRQMFNTPSAELLNMGKANRKLVKNRFSIERIAQANIDFFNRILGSEMVR